MIVWSRTGKHKCVVDLGTAVSSNITAPKGQQTCTCDLDLYMMTKGSSELAAVQNLDAFTGDIQGHYLPLRRAQSVVSHL